MPGCILKTHWVLTLNPPCILDVLGWPFSFCVLFSLMCFERWRSGFRNLLQPSCSDTALCCESSTFWHHTSFSWYCVYVFLKPLRYFELHAWWYAACVGNAACLICCVHDSLVTESWGQHTTHGDSRWKILINAQELWAVAWVQNFLCTVLTIVSMYCSD